MARKRRGRGEGSIYQRKDGTWVANVSFGYRANGRRIRKEVTGKTKKSVQEKLRAVMQQSGQADVTKMKLAEHLAIWLKSKKRKLAPGTYANYERMIRLHIIPHIGHCVLAKLRPLHVSEMYTEIDEAGGSANIQREVGSVLFSAMSQAVKLRLIESNPCHDIDRPRVEKPEMKIFSREQVDTFFEYAKDDDLYPLYVTAIATAMRSGELYALYWKDINFETKSIHVQRSLEEIGGHQRLKPPKSSHSNRRIELPKFAMDVLHSHRKKALTEGLLDSPVFCDSNGGWLRRSNVARRSFHPLLKRAKLPRIRFHDLRHTAATLLLLQGVHPKIVSERLGHASIEITLNTYSHVLPSMQKAAAEKLDQLFG